ncbi:hypothetical protein [Methanococcus sp. CF]
MLICFNIFFVIIGTIFGGPFLELVDWVNQARGDSVVYTIFTVSKILGVILGSYSAAIYTDD